MPTQQRFAIRDDPSIALAVIIPTLNERGNISALIDDLDIILEELAWEAIFVDDGSTDGTVDLIVECSQRRRNVRLIRRIGRRGLSSAVVEGMLATTAPIVAVIDADRQHDETILPLLYKVIVEDGADLAIGSRYTTGKSVAGWSKVRSQISVFSTILAQRLTRLSVTDPMSGFFMIRQSRLVQIAPRLSTIGFKILLDIMLSSKESLKIMEVPYQFRNRSSGESKLSTSVAVDYGLLLIEKSSRGLLTPRLTKFMLVGGFGLVVNLLLLKVLLIAGADRFAIAQAIAVTLTIALNFFGNNWFTYGDRRLTGLKLWSGLASFYLICGLGAAANVWLSNLVYSVYHVWWIAGTVGAATSALWNYMASSVFTWKRA